MRRDAIPRIVSVGEMRALDQRAIRDFKIPALILMENAGLRCADFIAGIAYRLSAGKIITVVCGCGNNGGDGFVIARHLMNRGFDARVFVLGGKTDIRGDALTNLVILEKMKTGIFFAGNDRPLAGSWRPAFEFRRALEESRLIVDAIFGTGLARPIEDPVKSYIGLMNASDRPIVAVDAPSGLDCDTGKVLGIAVKARYTLTMAAMKKGFLKNQGTGHCGKVVVMDISIPRSII